MNRREKALSFIDSEYSVLSIMKNIAILYGVKTGINQSRDKSLRKKIGEKRREIERFKISVPPNSLDYKLGLTKLNSDLSELEKKFYM